MKSSDRDGIFIPLDSATKGIAKRFRRGLALVQNTLFLGLLLIACKEEIPTTSPTIEKKEESPVLRAHRMTEWVLETYDSIESGFAKAESELTKDNPNIERILNEIESLIIGKASEAVKRGTN